MIEIPVHDHTGKQVDSLQIDEQQLGGEVRPALLKQAYVRFHANRRLGAAATRARHDTEGSTRKLYRQKGTGRARRGSVRTNLMRGGGVAFGKQPKSWRLRMPKQMRQLANRNALLAKAVDDEIKVVDRFSFDAPSTKQFAAMLQALSINRSCLLALTDTAGHVARSAGNIADLSLTQIERLNAFDLLNHRYLLVEKQALEAWLSPAKRDEAEPEAKLEKKVKARKGKEVA